MMMLWHNQFDLIFGSVCLHLNASESESPGVWRSSHIQTWLAIWILACLSLASSSTKYYTTCFKVIHDSFFVNLFIQIIRSIIGFFFELFFLSRGKPFAWSPTLLIENFNCVMRNSYGSNEGNSGRLTREKVVWFLKIFSRARFLQKNFYSKAKNWDTLATLL